MKKFTQLFITVLVFITAGAWSVSAWGADCNYTVSNFVSSKNTEKNGDTYLFGRKNYYDVPTFEFGNVTNNYGISHVKLSLKFGGLHAVTEKFQLQYKVGSGSWTNIGSQVTASVISTDIDQDVSIAGATEQKVYFRLNRVEKAKFTDTQTLTLSGFEVRMASNVAADKSTIDFGTLTYGNSKSEKVTATYTLNYSGDMTATCTGDYSATVTAGCNCSTSQQTKEITVTFTPTQAGTRTGKLTIKNPNGTSTTVDLTGVCNRANPTLNMSNNGSVNVTTDKANPVELDLSTLKASGTTTGIGAFDSFVLQSADASTGAKADGVTIDGSKFSSTVGGKYTVRATTKQNNQYNSTYKDFTVTVNRLTQTISWSTDESVFVEEDEVTATSIGDVTLTKSGAGEDYVTIEGNTATVGEVEANSSVTLTATAAQTDVYAQATDSKTITLTSLQKQHITFDQNLTKLKTTDGTKKVELVATSDSGRDSYITFAVDANTAGVSVTHEGDKWYLNYTATAVKGIAVTASLAGEDGVSVAASPVSQMVKVTDPTAVCDVTETLSSAYGLKSTSKTYNLTIPKKVVFKVRCSEKNLLLVQGYEIKFYKGNTQVGETYSYGVDDGHYYNQDVKTRTFDNLDKDITKVVVTSNASKGYDITEASYERYSYANPSKSELSFEAYALSTVADQEFTLSYANYQIELSIEGSSNFVIKSEDSFGDCETYGSKTVKVGYNVPAVKCEESATLYIKDNAGNTLNTVTLNANVLGGLTQNIDSHNIKTSYKTTDLINLTATTDRGLTNFTYTASPAGVASFDGNVMTFSQSGTIAITVTEAGNATFNEATATVENVVVSKVAPDIAENPSGTAIPYLGTLNGSTLTGGSADITLRGAAHTGVAGSFGWTEPTHVVKDAAGTHSYSVTFTPTDGGMYATKEFTIPITITRATQALAMNNGTVKVAVDGIDEGAADSYLDLNTLIIAAQTTSDIVSDVKRDGAVTYAVISENKDNATLSGSTFSADVCDIYTIRATKAETDYYNEVTAEFTVTVEIRANTLKPHANCTTYVEQHISDAATLINSDGTIHTSSTDDGIAHYDIAQKKIIVDNSGNVSFDQKDVTIKIWQDATDRFEGIAEADAKIIVVTVKKYDNNFSCSWGSWTKRVNFEDVFDVEFTTNNTDYTHFPIQITQATGETVATLVKNDDTHCTITASYTRADATWNLYQAENYKYKAATKTGVKVEVRVLPAVCYLYEDNTEHSFSTAITDISGHFDPAVAINGPVKQISFDAKRDFAGFDYFVVQYSVDNGANWRDIIMPDLSTSYETYGPYDFTGLQANEKVTHIRFGAKSGATESKYYKNVKVSRATSIKPEDENGNLIETLTMPQNTIDGTTTAKFYMNYSSCDDVIKIVSNNAHFTVDQPTITVDHSKGYNRAEVTVSYTADAKGTHTGTITLYTKYQNRTFTVTGTTDKKVQTLDWQPGFEGDPMTLSVGLTVDNVNKAAVANSERSVVYSTDNAQVIKITLGGLGFEVIGTGTATLTAAVAEDDYWFPVSESKTVNATNKKIQVIVWNQDLMRGLKLNDVIDLEAKVFIRNMSNGSLAEDATRTPFITYSCEANDVISLDAENKQITVTGYGNATIIANVAGDGTTYEAAQPVTMYVKVRQPSSGCETPLVLDHADNVQLFSMDMQLSGGFSDWTTPEITSDPIILDPAKGKPDKLSYQHNGELYTIRQGGWLKLCRGTVMAQQRVNGQWSNIEGSEYNNGGKEGSEGYYDWRLVEDLQLDENADAIRFRRLNAGQGYHNFKDIKITLKHYLRPTVEEVDLKDIEMGESRSAMIGFDYSDVKGDLAATKGSEDATYVINETLMEMDCGAHGHYDLPITITPTAVGPWSTTIIIEDQFTHETTTLLVKANVKEGVKYIFNGGEGEAGMIWGEDTNWGENQQPDAGAAVIVNSDVIITGEVTVGSLTISDQTTVTVAVTGTLNLGDGSSVLQENYGNLHIEKGGQVNVGSGALLVNDLILDAKLGDGTTKAASGQLRDEQDKLVVLKKANFDLTFDPGDRITYGWYDFTVPFPVNINGGIKRVKGAGLEPMVCGRDFLIMEDDEASFVNGGKGWHRLNSGVLQPGKLYTITFDDEVDQNTFRFIWNGQGDLTNGESFAAEYLTGSDESRNGWNAIGNGMLRHGYIGGGYKIQTFNHTDNVYELVSGNKTFAVGTAFFVQVSTAGNINWTAADASDLRPLYAPQRETREIEEFRLSLSNEATGLANDVLFFSASDDATEAYVIGHDLLKRGTPTEAKKAQMWATKGGKTLCDVESQLVGTKASAPLSLFTPEAGTFELAVEEAPEDASLFLTYNDRAIWNLSMSPYLFDLSKGTTEGYGLRLVVQTPQNTTDLENGEAAEGENGVRKVLIDNVLYLITPDGKMYDVVGKGVKF